MATNGEEVRTVKERIAACQALARHSLCGNAGNYEELETDWISTRHIRDGQARTTRPER